MTFNFKLLPRCGAKARSRDGEPCKQAQVMNGSGRCYWHGGATPKKHGQYSKKTMEERKNFRQLIKDVKNNIHQANMF